eukprot:g7987.t1
MKYLQLLTSACNSCNDEKLSAILKVADNLGRSTSATSSSAISGGLYASEFKSLNLNDMNTIQKTLGQMLSNQGWKSVCMSYLKTKNSYVNHSNYKQAFEYMTETYTLFLKLFETPDESFWLKNTLQILSVNLRVLGKECDRYYPGDESTYREVVALLRKGFQATVASRALIKKEAAIGVVNNLLKVYFKNNALGLCEKTFKGFKVVFRSIDFHTLPLAQRITYRFYEGRLAIFQEDYVKAENRLKFCFKECPKNEKRNRARILQYLIPVQIYFGIFPSHRLIEKYDLNQYIELVPAIVCGDIQNFEKHMKLNQSFFLNRGIYLLIEKLKTILYRNLIFKIYNILGKNSQDNKINLKTVLPTLKQIGSVEDMDGLECMLANLIFSKYVKGYISHAKFYLVFSKLTPFPNLSEVGDLKRTKEMSDDLKKEMEGERRR